MRLPPIPAYLTIQWFSARERKRLPRTVRYVSFRSYRNFDESKFRQSISSQDWSQVTSCQEIDLAAERFRDLIINTLDIYAPVRNLKLREYAPPWLTTEYLSLVDMREYWCAKYNKS